MPLFHWIFCSALTLLALLLIGSQLTKARKKRVEENLETCGVCGEPRPADRLVGADLRLRLPPPVLRRMRGGPVP